MAKSFILVLFLYCTIGTSWTQAKVWRVNNNQGVHADFTTLQAAHNGATAGDTLYLEGSPTSYGSLSATKKLVVIGPGYFLSENNISPIDNLSAKVGQISMLSGSAGSEIMGLDFNGGSLLLYTSDIVIQRNKFSLTSGNNHLYYGGNINFQSASANNVIIRQNLGVSIHSSHEVQGTLIMNNLLMAYGDPNENTTGNCLFMNEFVNAIVQNNIFRRGTVNAARSVFSNNIMVNGTFVPGLSQYSNNIGNAGQFGTANGNQSNVTMSEVFVGTGTADAQWKLKAGSPAIGAGYGSTTEKPVDCGMFWGNSAYKLSGIPGLPVIYDINVQAIGSNTDPIKVTLKVKSTQ